jgi:RNA polymerase sigma-70 factor (ECF subfamily)
MREPHKALIERLFSTHGAALQAFFRRRIRSKPEAPDLTQEVYLRMLRIDDAQVIHNPEGYLYSVASNLVKERAVVDRRISVATSGDAQLENLFAELPSSEELVDTDARARRLREVLLQLTPKCRAALVLQYRHDMSYQQIAEQLGVSVNMVKKYLAQGLALCRRRMERMR